jgi:protein gp37
MNRTKIDYADYSWNPVTGCRHGCDYCYARKMVKRFGHYGGSFEPQFHPGRLDEPFKQKKPGVIFVCDMGDIFSPGVKKVWRDMVMCAAIKAPWHTYLWLTKNPQYDKSWVRSNWWLGASITGPEDAYKRELLYGKNIWYSYEPLLGLPDPGDAWHAEQIVIGRATNSKLPYTNVWAKVIISRHPEAKAFVKDNGAWPGAPKQLCWTVAKRVEEAKKLTKPTRLSKGHKHDRGVAGTSLRG